MNNTNSILNLISNLVIISSVIYFIYTYFVCILIVLIMYIIILLQKYKIENKILNNKITILNNKNAKVFKRVAKNMGMKKRICVVCNITCKKKCERCKTAYYCCIEHQRENWPYHKTVCKLNNNNN